MFLYDLVSSKSIVIPTIIFTIKRGESHILFITNKPKLLVRSHVILDYTRNSVYLFEIPGGKYIIDIFSDVVFVDRCLLYIFIKFCSHRVKTKTLREH